MMIFLYTLIIWKMYRSGTATKMRSFQSKTSIMCRFSSASLICSGSQTHLHSTAHPSSSTGSKDKQRRVPERVFSTGESDGEHHVSLRYRYSKKNDSREPHVHEHRSSRVICFLDSTLTKFDVNEGMKRAPPMIVTLIRGSSQRHIQRLVKKEFDGKTSSRMNRPESSSSSSRSLTRMDRQRRKALKLLIALIVEFFVCWTPLFIYHTVGTFDKKFYRSMPKIYVDLILLFSFASASCNPLTYYFMSERYRTVLYANLSFCLPHRYQTKLSQRSKQQINGVPTHQKLHLGEEKRKAMLKG